MNDFICWLMCKVGIHDWEKLSFTVIPRRQCSRCKRVQGLYRGCGSDDWLEIDSLERDRGIR